MAQGKNNRLNRQIPYADTTKLAQQDPVGASVGPIRRHARKASRPSQQDGNAKTLVSRRQLLFGALGVGVVAAGAAGASTLRSQHEEAEDVLTLEVPEEAVLDLESYAEVDPLDAFGLVGDYELPFGTLVWADDGKVAACLFPTDEPSPLVHMGMLSLENGSYFTLREHAVGAEEGFEIYDVRASSTGLVWMESAIMEGLWRIYTASLGADFSLGEAQLADEGDASTEVPTLAVAGDWAFWQTMAPITNDNARYEPATVKRAQLSTGKVDTAFESVGRMNAPIVPYQDSVVFTPRHQDALSYCDLVRLDAKSLEVLESLTLPAGMFPNQVGYGPTGFAFCFESIYDYGGGIANLGTYTPAETHDGNDYGNLEWFRFNRTPTAAPCWCTERWFMVKSNQSVCAVNFEHKVFCSFGVESGCLDWGDYLVSSGLRETVVTCMQIDQVDNNGEETKKTQVRVWQPLASVPESDGGSPENGEAPSSDASD